MRVKSKAGEMLIEGHEKKIIATRGGDPKKQCTKPSTLELGITRNESSQWQRLAKVPEPTFEKAVPIANEKPRRV